MRRRLLVLLSLVALAVAVAAPALAQDPIRAQDVERHLAALDRIAAENGGNRAAGLPGEAATAAYASDQLAAAGWNVSRTDVPFDFWAERSPGVVGAHRPGRDFVTLHYSGSGDVTARVRPINGGGCRRREFRRFPRGRIAMVAAAGCSFRRAANLARRAGARAVLVADFTDGPPTAGTLVRPGVGLPVVSVRLPILRRLARRRARIRVRVDAIDERRTTQNVIAELPGTAPDAVVMAGGHMDSIPRGPGINDNGSGVAALIEAGVQLARRDRGRATIRLAFWAAHENGIFGSASYVRRLPAEERRRIRAYLNIDMVASPNAVPEVYASRRSIRRVLVRHLRGAGRTSTDGGSDHTPFMKAGIPIGGIYTGSLEPKSRRQARRWGGTWGKERDECYHQPCDTLGHVSLRFAALAATATANALGDLAR
jgi:Iap family predicted aminopeptidase